MTKILAINPASKEAVERMEIDTMQQQFADFVRTDAEVIKMMRLRAAEIIGKMSNWDITYHCKLDEVAREIIATSPEFKDAVKQAIARVLASENDDVNYRVQQAVGEFLAGKITMKLDTQP